MKTLVMFVVLAAVSASPLLSPNIWLSELWLRDGGSSQHLLRVKREQDVDPTQICCGLNYQYDSKELFVNYEDCGKEFDEQDSNYKCDVLDCVGEKLGLIADGELLVDGFSNYFTWLYNEELKNLTTISSKICSTVGNLLSKDWQEDKCFSIFASGYVCTKALVERDCPHEKRIKSDSCKRLRSFFYDILEKKWNPHEDDQ